MWITPLLSQKIVDITFLVDLVDSAQKESRFPTGRISLHCNGVDECGQIISTVLCLQWL